MVDAAQPSRARRTIAYTPDAAGLAVAEAGLTPSSKPTHVAVFLNNVRAVGNDGTLGPLAVLFRSPADVDWLIAELAQSRLALWPNVPPRKS